MDNVKMAQQIIDNAIKDVHDLNCGIVADGTIDGNGIFLTSCEYSRKAPAKTAIPRNRKIHFVFRLGAAGCFRSGD